jgi:hypothetical protein
MMFVAELHGLRPLHVLPRKIRRTRKPQHASQAQSRQENPGEQTEPGDKIRAAVKNLSHDFVAPWRVSDNGAALWRFHPQWSPGQRWPRGCDAIVSNKSIRIATAPRPKFFFLLNAFFQILRPF